MTKKSIRFFNDREVRAVWDKEHSKWWFLLWQASLWAERSATDIVRAVNDDDYEDYNVSNELQIEYYD